MQAFTVDHFRAYASRIVLDTGTTWNVEDFQLQVFEPIFDGATETWAVLPEGSSKCLDVTTPLPTPDGWTTMLDVQAGDWLLDSAGEPTLVGHASEVKFGLDCYRVAFSDGASIVCDADHLWQVEDAQDHYRPKVRSIRQLLERPLRLRKNKAEVARWRIPCAARQGPQARLPVDPYVLGIWLGDGHTDCGRVTNEDPEVWDEIETAGYSIGPRTSATAACTRTVYKLHQQLRWLGVLGYKHIPEMYLLASEEQRQALLEGLMDSDGCVSKTGAATFSSTNERLGKDFRRLAWSLGHPCSWNEYRAMLDGWDCGSAYQLSISCDRTDRIARLKRKASRLKQHGYTADHRRIVAIERVPSRPVKCVEVHADDHLYLAGEAYIPTHNTTMFAGFALYHCDFTPNPWVPIAASSRDQAEIMARQAYQMIRMTPGFSRRFKIYEGYREIRSLANGGRGIKVYAADISTADGVIPTLALCDEGHRWPDLGVYRLWKGKLEKRGGQIAMMSTAGEPGSEFEEVRDTIRKSATNVVRNGAHVRYESRSDDGGLLVMNEWMVRDEKLIPNKDVEHPVTTKDMEPVKQANPFSGVTARTLAAAFNSPTMDLGEFKRLKANIPARTVLAAITELEWANAYLDLHVPDGEHIDCGHDTAWKHDTTAIQPLWRTRIGEDLSRPINLLGWPKVLTPPRDGSTMHPDVVKRAYEELLERWIIDTVVMDMERAEDIAAWLQDEHSIEVIDRTTGNAMQIEDYDEFMKQLRTGLLRHNGHPELKKHAMNAIARKLPGDKTRFDRPSQSRAKRKQETRVIDALTAAGMVVWYAGEPVEGPQEPLVAWR